MEEDWIHMEGDKRILEEDGTWQDKTGVVEERAR